MEAGNFGAAAAFVMIFAVLFYPIWQYFGGIPPASYFAYFGISTGESIIILLIVGVVMIWSFSQIVTLIAGAVVSLISAIINNETLRNLAGAVGRKANRTIGKTIRETIRDIYRDMKDHESL